ncbi:unnamed protein product [Closterium sp. NIES-65]|nr:unnamed protein product [Closterium sp. NIES-65]CAI5954807.1 unnamed protein product [Closterium sp. NIES-65]
MDLFALGYAASDTITTLFRIVKNYDMPAFLKLDFIRVSRLSFASARIVKNYDMPEFLKLEFIRVSRLSFASARIVKNYDMPEFLNLEFIRVSRLSFASARIVKNYDMPEFLKLEFIRVSRQLGNATAPATSAKAAAAPANATKSGNATKVANSAHGVATARLSKGAGEGKNSTCAYYGNYNANPYFGKGLTAKIPDALFSKRCGACFKVICSNDTKRCRSGKATVTVRVVGATKTEGKQISLSAVSWAKIVQGSETAPVNITYKRTNCVSTAGSAVRVRSNSTAEHFNIQMVGLAGPGTLTEVELSADGKKWVKLTRDGNKAIWGIKGKEAKAVVGAKKAMSVRLTAGHTREKITLANVIPTAWKPQTLYSSKTNFKKLMAEAK